MISRPLTLWERNCLPDFYGVRVPTSRLSPRNPQLAHTLIRCARSGEGRQVAVRRDADEKPSRRGDAGEGGGKRGGSKSSVKGERVVDEEIYSIGGGWKVDPAQVASVEDLESLGFQMPQRTKRQVDKEQQASSRGTGGAHSAPEERLTHRKLRVMAGSQGGRRLLSPSDAKVRPMMEVVRGAVFSMLQAMVGSPLGLPGGRWLDLYSGTGSVGIEGLSRGCTEAQFVEMDPWVVAKVLRRNLDSCALGASSLVHTARVETFLQRAAQNGVDKLGGCFDYVSVTPPYEAVVFADLMEQVGASPLLGPDTFIIVEYPLRSKDEMPPQCGPLKRVRDRRYGRTHVAVYGPEWVKEE